MTDGLSCIGAYDSSYLPGVSDDRSAYSSELTPILSDLRRKYVVNSGPHNMSLIDSAIDPVGGPTKDDYLETSATCTCLGESWNGSGRKLSITSPGSVVESSMKNVNGDQTRNDELCPICGRKKSVGPLGGHVMLASSLKTSRRRNSGLPKKSTKHGNTEPHHEEELLQSTPHLRHLSAASTDMQGAGNLTTSRNILNFVLPSSQSKKSAGNQLDSTSSNSRQSFGSALDYRSSLIRDKANNKAATALASFLWVLAHEMSLEEYGAVENEVFTEVFHLVHSADNERRMAGVAALDALIDAPSADEDKKGIKFSNNLSNALRTPQTSDYEFLAAVARALGHIASGAADVDHVEYEVVRALEWLRTERSDRRLAASLTLKELAVNAPTAFYSKTSQPSLGHVGSNGVLDNIFPVLRDSQPIVRVCAADALSECLKIVVERQHVSLTGLLCQVYFNMMDGLSQEPRKKNGKSSAASIARAEAAHHGSLLVVASMLEFTEDFMLPRFDECCVAVFAFADHPKALIRLEVVRLMPRLARRCPGVFGRRYLEEGLEFLIQCASSPTSPRVGVDVRPSAFAAIGQLIIAMGDSDTGSVIGGADLPTVRILKNPDTSDGSQAYIIEHSETGIIYDKLNEIFLIARSGLKRSSPTEASRSAGASTRSAALHCCADLVKGLGPMAHPYIDDLLKDMFGSGLSEDLIQCLRSIAACLPSQQTVIEDRLLQEVSLCLAGTPSARSICDPIAFSRVLSSKSPAPISSTPSRNYQYNQHSGAEWLDEKARKDAFQSRDDIDPLRNGPGSETRSLFPQVSLNMSDRGDVVTNLVLCLSTLASFGDSKGRVGTEGTVIVLLPFVREVASKYFSHPSAEVRRAAALTCCTLLVPRDGNPSVKLNHSLASQQMQLRSRVPAKRRLGHVSGRIVEDVLCQLLELAVSDDSPVVRLCVVRALDERYDPLLCQTHHIQPLILLLEDETLVTRAAGLHLLGRLARLNPGPILPVLRHLLVDILLQLRCGGDTGRGREEAARLLIIFLRAESLQRLVHPILPSLVSSLPLEGVTPRLAAAALEALGELAQACPSALNPWVPQLIPYILDTLLDQSSSSKQRISLRTLGQISTSTGYVITPYIDYPQLLSQAADVLPGAKRAPWTLRREVIRTLGILGALDPDRYHAVASKARKGGAVGGGYFVENEANASTSDNTVRPMTTPVEGSESKTEEPLSTNSVSFVNSKPQAGAVPMNARRMSRSTEENRETAVAHDDMPAHLYMYELYTTMAQPDSELPPARRLTPADEDFYPTVAIQALTRIFKDPSLAVHHGMVMQAIMFIFNSLGLRCVPFLERVVPHILESIKTCGPANLRESLLKQLVALSGIVREHLRPYVASIFDIVDEFWSSRYLGTVLSLVSKLAAGVPNEFSLFLPDLVRKLLASLEEIQVSDWLRNDIPGSTDDIQKLELVLRSIRSLRLVLGDFMHVLVPALVKLSESLISPTSEAREGYNFSRSLSATLIDVAVLTLQTLSVLLDRNGGSPSARVGDVSWGVSCYASLPSSSSLAARAVHPMIRLLGQDVNAGRTVGFAIVETICVCAKQLGDKWMPLYNKVARHAIWSWQLRVGLPTSENIGGENGEIRSGALTGLSLYDEVMKQHVKFNREGESFVQNEYQSLLRFGQRQDATLRSGLSLELTQSRGSEVFASFTSETILTSGIDSSPDQLDVDVQTNPSVQPVLNQTSRHRINQGNLQRAWDVSQHASREDWTEWMRRFSIQLLREAPSPALRACASLAHAYQPLARELFSGAFVCCWEELSDQCKANLLHALESAFVADVSPEILQSLLNLAIFMEHDGVDTALPIDISILAELALKCRAYAKALHYKEREHRLGGGGSCVEALISINKKLDLPEAALGVLKASQVQLERSKGRYGHVDFSNKPSVEDTENISSHFNLPRHEMLYGVVSSTDGANAWKDSWAGAEIKVSWLAKLGSWSEALTMYEQKLAQNPRDYDAILGCMRCLDAQGEWKRVLDLAETTQQVFSASWDDYKDEAPVAPVNSMDIASRSHRKVSKFCAQAAWRLGRWEELEKCAAHLLQGKHVAAHRRATIMNNGVRDRVTPVDFDGAFFSGVLHIHRKEWSLAADAIDAARNAMDSRFTALMAESYKRAYPNMVKAQTLAEMEEIIEYKKLESRAQSDSYCHTANTPDVSKAREQLLSVWRSRLQGCRVDAESHSSILAVRSLVLGPLDEVESTLTLSELSRQARRFKLAERVLLNPLNELGADLNGPVFGFDSHAPRVAEVEAITNMGSYSVIIDRLLNVEPAAFSPKYDESHYGYSVGLIKEAGSLERLTVQQRLYFAYVNHLWCMNKREEAMARLGRLSSVIDLIAHSQPLTHGSLSVDCWLKLGDWRLVEGTSLGDPIAESLQADVMTAFKRAISSDHCGYSAWHAWALLNFRIAQQLSEKEDMSPSGSKRKSRRSLTNHVIAAVKGFVNAICQGTKGSSASVQQDMLNLLTCLFKYGELPEVASSLSDGINAVSIEAWLGVLPQLLARIHIRSPSVRSVLHPLLTRLGEKHPQALMYPLSVLVKSPVVDRKTAAESLMNTLKAHSSALVEEALMVSSELIRVAILWLETWHEGLEEASRLYFGDHDVSGMLDLLLPMHEKLEDEAETRREQDFVENFGEELAQAHALVVEYVRIVKMDNASHEIEASEQNAEAESAILKAWDTYYVVFRKINKQLPRLTKLELSDCSPALSRAHNLELGVPGTYRVDGSYVKIEKFIPKVQVITSKQRPRKITLRGSDGKDYVFLLKGHEDLRQDERVMQLFGLVNALLARDSRTNKHDLNIQRYAISPLSHNCGVVGWVPHTDTFHTLIRDYRQTKRVPLNSENRLMLEISPDYDRLNVMQKVEVFNEALRRTTGNGYDMYEILWIKSTNSEEWLERRTKYTRSLAVMSMVGYILGLGDRHPSNLMLDQVSGRVLHIDFGDCFEVAMNRERYPEKVPFRLTRMLVKAMEVSGIEGSYRSTSERTMGVLRDSRDSLVAMLEAFVYDPLISWRLVGLSSSEASVENPTRGDKETEVSLSPASQPGRMVSEEDPSYLRPSQKVLYHSIREGQEESTAETDDVHGRVLGERIDVPKSLLRTDAMSAARARSLQQYSDLQDMAAKLNTSSRISSITGGGHEKVSEGSMAKSRIARSFRQREIMSLLDGGDTAAHEEALNEKALKVIRRVQDKLTGTDFQDLDDTASPLDVSDQVQRLIVQASSSENLCQLYLGWCAFW